MKHFVVAMAFLISTPLYAGEDENSQTFAQKIVKRKSTAPVLRTSSSDITAEDSSLFRDRVSRVCGGDAAQQTKFHKYLREVTPSSARKDISEKALSYLARHKARFAPHQYVQLLDLLPEGHRSSKNLKLIESCLTPHADDAEKHWFIQTLMEMKPEDMVPNLRATHRLLRKTVDLSEREFILRVVNLLPGFQRTENNTATLLHFLKSASVTDTVELFDAVRGVRVSDRLDVVSNTAQWLGQCPDTVPCDLKLDALDFVKILDRHERPVLASIARALKDLEPLSQPSAKKKLDAEVSILDLLVHLTNDPVIRRLYY